MAPPLAYFLSWTTYGTWLPGDSRGWVDGEMPGIQEPNHKVESASKERMKEPSVMLDAAQRVIVRETIEAHCQIRKWTLHAANPRSNHIHVVVTAPEIQPEAVLDQFKAWCSRRLNERYGKRSRWWPHHGSTKWINDEEYLRDAITYVLEKQGPD